MIESFVLQESLSTNENGAISIPQTKRDTNFPRQSNSPCDNRLKVQLTSTHSTAPVLEQANRVLTFFLSLVEQANSFETVTKTKPREFSY
jgi:hypothetical protein